MTSCRAIAAALILVAWTAVARGQQAPAAAPQPPADPAARKAAAQGHLDRGNELFTQDEFAGALAEFKAAIELYPSTRLEFNLGQCERALGHAAAAVDHFQKFLTGPDAVSPALREEAERYVAELERAEAAAGPAPPPPAPAPPATTPAPAPPLLEAKHEPPPATPVYKRWWFWTAVGVVAAGAVVGVMLATQPRDPACVPDPPRQYCP